MAATAPRSARVLDAGCGEGMLVEEYAGRLAIEGIDANYSSDRVRSGISDRAAVSRMAPSIAQCVSTSSST